MTASQITMARQLQDEGRSLQYIADKLDVPKSSLHRALRDDDTMPIGDAPTDVKPTDTDAKPTEKRPAPASQNVELGKLDLQLSHERKMAELKIRQDELAIQRRQVELDAERAANEKELLAIRQQQFQREQDQEEEKVVAEKEMVVERHNKLVRELLKNCEDATWSETEVDEFIARIKKVQTKITKLCDRHIMDEEGLAIYHHSAALLKLIETTKEEESSFFSSNVSFDFEKPQIKTIKSWLIEDFENEYVKPAKKKCADDDDEEEEDDDEDDDDDTKGLSGISQEKKLVKTFNGLVKDFAQHVEGIEWEKGEYDEFETQIESFQDELTEYTGSIKKPLDTDRHALSVRTEDFWDYVSGREAVVKEDDDKLTLFANLESKEWLKTLPVEDFWEELEEDEDEQPTR